MAVCVSEPVEGTPAPSEITSSNFYSQTPELQRSIAAANPQLVIDRASSASQRAIAAAYNRLGNLFRRLAALVNVPIAAALAVWLVESSGLAFVPGRAVLRFEVGKFLAAWGHENLGSFDAHFQCGGHNGIAGEPWQKHAFRLSDEECFTPVHANSTSEYAALQLAGRLSSLEIALRCASIGGCQILLSNYAMLGYASATEMFDAFQRSESAHVLGFFDFCARQAGCLIGCLRNREFAAFALHYNGPGQLQLYVTKLCSATADAETVLAASCDYQMRRTP